MVEHGGKREGSGRKMGSTKWGETTKTVRIPQSMDVAKLIQIQNLQDKLLEIAIKVKNNEDGYTANSSASLRNEILGLVGFEVPKRGKSKKSEN